MNNGDETSSVNGSQEEAKEEPEETEVEPTATAISENDAEVFCQDATLLDKYVYLDDVDIIDMWNYNKTFTEWGYFDEEGNDVAYLSWTGKDKILDEPISFGCWAAGTKDNTKLMQLNINGEVHYSQPMYDEDGNEAE